ncbi:MAG: hypothetical protein ABI082_03905 [Dokdonella sp.]
MTMQDDEAIRLLRDLRAGQQEHLALYREITQRSLDAQQTAIELHCRSARLYRIVVTVGAILMIGLIIYLQSLPI